MPEFSLSGNLNDYFKSDEWIQLIGKMGGECEKSSGK